MVAKIIVVNYSPPGSVRVTISGVKVTISGVKVSISSVKVSISNIGPRSHDVIFNVKTEVSD